MNNRAEEVMDFLDKNPKYNGKVVGYKADRGGFGVSRIDNDWYSCDDYFVSIHELIKLI